MLAIIPAWVISAILIGFFGRRYRFGFWGYFFASVLLTPFIGLLMLIAAAPTREFKKTYRR
jgi:hypothetical protein